MAQVKIYIEDGENLDDVKMEVSESLQKSLNHYHEEKYADPLAEDWIVELEKDTQDIYKNMWSEISAILARDIFRNIE